MKLVGSRGQHVSDVMYDASGTIASGGAAQLLLPERVSTSSLLIQNISDTDMFIEFGSARATATLTSGVVTSVSVANGGFGFTIAPVIQFLGGGNVTGWNSNNGAFLGCGQPDYQAPSQVATAHATLSGGAVNAIVVDYGGAKYAVAPYVYITNSKNDPFGCASPSATVGIRLLAGGGTYTINGTVCPTDPISIFCVTTGKAFTCKWTS